MTKSLRIILILSLLSLFVFIGQNFKVSRAQTPPYTPPLRSWIKLGAVAYQTPSSMTPEKLEWAAAHFDWFDSPNKDLLASYKTKTKAPMVVYDNYYCIYIGWQEKYKALVDYVNANSLNLEDMFVHYSEDTQVTFGNETHVLPAGSRVPTYGWYGTGGDLTKDGARVVMNVGNPNYRAFNAQWQKTLTSTSYNGATYDGIFVDNTGKGILTATGTIGFGGNITEYPGDRTTRNTAYDADIVKAFQEVRTAFGPKGIGNKLQVPNIANLANWPELFSYVDGFFREFVLGFGQDGRGSFEAYLATIKETDSLGIQSYNTGFTDESDRQQLSLLAVYYLASSPYTYFIRQDSNAGDLQTYAWLPAIEYNVGQPRSDTTIFASGVDPSSTMKDSGEGVVTNNGADYGLTDANKNWPTDYWKGLSLVDSNKNIFQVWKNETNTLHFYRERAPYPVSGHYEVGNFIYTIYSREFENALVIYKIRPSAYNPERGDPSATTHNLSATADNPTGRYYKLKADGTLEATPRPQITLRTTEGVILIKESKAIGVILSKTVDKSQAQTGDILTYTLNYQNGINQSNNAKLEDPIPTGTTYVNGSATNNGTFDGTKVIWNLGNLASGVSGTAQFQVTVQ